MDWIRYANQGAVRNQPISRELVDALSFLPELGVQMEVFSGGQDSHGPNRVGSTRHDHGNAGDVFFHANGRRLDWANPDDLPIFQEIVRRSRANGITGIGAGDGYMRPGSMHIGFGNEAVWGAGGSGANAPDWLRSSFHYEGDGHNHGGHGPRPQGQNSYVPYEPIPNALTQMQQQSQNALAAPPQPPQMRNSLSVADFLTPQAPLALQGYNHLMRPQNA